MFTFPDGIKTAGPGQSGYPEHDCNCCCRIEIVNVDKDGNVVEDAGEARPEEGKEAKQESIGELNAPTVGDFWQAEDLGSKSPLYGDKLEDEYPLVSKMWEKGADIPGIEINEEKVNKALKEAQAALNKLGDHEESYTVALSGEIIAHNNSGLPGKVYFDTDKAQNAIVAHNHLPQSANSPACCTFSIADLLNYLGSASGNRPGIYGVFTDTKDGRFVSLNRGKDAQYGKFSAYICENLTDDDVDQEATRRVADKYNQDKTDMQEWGILISKAKEAVTNKWLEKYARTFGFEFGKGEI